MGGVLLRVVGSATGSGSKKLVVVVVVGRSRGLNERKSWSGRRHHPH